MSFFDSLRLAIALGLTLFLVLLRFDAERITRSDYFRYRTPWMGPVSYYILVIAFAVGIAVILPSGREQLFLTGGDPDEMLPVMLLFTAIALLNGVALAFLRYGGILPLPIELLPTRVLGAAANAISEELQFRSIVLGLLIFAGVEPGLAIGFQALVYGLVQRRLWRERDWYFLVGSVLLGWAAGVATVQTGSIIPAIVGHFAVTMSLFAFAGGRLRQRPIWGDGGRGEARPPGLPRRRAGPAAEPNLDQHRLQNGHARGSPGTRNLMATDETQTPPHHLYVHVPFCRLVCAYCDFVTVGGRAAEIPRYVGALMRELDARPAPGEMRTIYFGGGTPSLLTGEQAGRVIGAATDRWEHVAIEEVTVEANPSERERPDWVGLRRAGVTRISLGVQSLRDADLVALARGHTAREARTAFAAARAAGFDNVSIDLIYGIPGQSLTEWGEGLRMALELEPDHLSCYALQLTLAPDEWAAPPRPGALRWRNRLALQQDDGLASDQYRLAEEVLAAAGYRHYELSSWARPGRESRHNSAYWARSAYTGIGAGAHSYDGTAERSWNLRELDDYLSAAEAGERPLADREVLDGETRAFEAIALGLRRVDGVDRRAFAEEFGADPVERIRGTDGLALLEWDTDRLRLTPRGRLFASEACLAFLPEPVA